MTLAALVMQGAPHMMSSILLTLSAPLFALAIPVLTLAIVLLSMRTGAVAVARPPSEP
jgi:hypothetical protein